MGFLGWYKSLLPGTSVNGWIFFCHVHVVCVFSAYAGMIPASPAVKCSTKRNIKEKLNRKVSWYHHIQHSLNCMGRNTLKSLSLTYLEKLSLRTQFIFSCKRTTLFHLTFKVALKWKIWIITSFKSWSQWFLSSFVILSFILTHLILGMGKMDSQNQQHKSTLFFF